MNTSPEVEKPVVVLIGNYPIDRQESMLRFRDLVESRLTAAGYTTESVFPQGYLGTVMRKGPLAKWLGYIDKYILFPSKLAGALEVFADRKYSGRKVVVHICDHSNAVYARLARRWFPVLVTCHDLLAVRGALGEDTDCPASGFGKRLQATILYGLGQASRVACVSRATQADLIRLLGPGMAERSEVIPLALNYDYHPLTREQSLSAFARAGIDLPYGGYVLHVGSALRRKNREALLHSVARVKDQWPGKIVFAGEALSDAERMLALDLGVKDRVLEISRPDNETLLALYAAAHAFIFMSRFEGFGWPILEAQMAGCPVICSNRTSVPEVAGEGAFIHEPDDYAAIGADILRLEEPELRGAMIAFGVKNARLYSNERMMGAYEEIYRQLQ
jgi:glycosyltransferase involved in cell wall biosynthesis